MNEIDKIIWECLIDSFTSDWIELKCNKNYSQGVITKLDIEKSLMKFFIKGLIESLNDSLEEWRLTKSGKFIKDNFITLINSGI